MKAGSDQTPAALQINPLQPPLTKSQRQKLRKARGKLARQGNPSSTSTAGSTGFLSRSQGPAAGGQPVPAESLSASATAVEVATSSAAASVCQQGGSLPLVQLEASSAPPPLQQVKEAVDAASSGPCQPLSPTGASLRVDLSRAARCLAQHLTGDSRAEAGGAEQQQQPPKRQREQAVHGNYHRYYGKRLGPDSAEDPRLQVLEEKWFRGQRCLDIGCNEGLLTLQLAHKFGTARMTGVDIDEHLIKEACRNLQEMRAAVTNQLRADTGPKASLRRAVGALAATSFRHADFLAEAPPEAGSLDAILCLSVTKWLHLFGGDAGLESLFGRCSAGLREGGLLLLEPQPWKSYQAALKRPGASKAGYVSLASLKLRPEQFVTHLTKRHGFRLVSERKPDKHLPGFNRPLLLLERLSTREEEEGEAGEEGL